MRSTICFKIWFKTHIFLTYLLYVCYNAVKDVEHIYISRGKERENDMKWIRGEGERGPWNGKRRYQQASKKPLSDKEKFSVQKLCQLIENFQYKLTKPSSYPQRPGYQGSGRTYESATLNMVKPGLGRGVASGTKLGSKRGRRKGGGRDGSKKTSSFCRPRDWLITCRTKIVMGCHRLGGRAGHIWLDVCRSSTLLALG